MSSAQYPGRLSSPITDNLLKGQAHSMLSGLIQDLDSITKGVSPNKQKHSAAIREGVKKVKQRLKKLIARSGF